MKISSLAKPTAAALALTFCGTHYVSAQENDSVRTSAAEQANSKDQVAEDDDEKDQRSETCSICGMRVEAKQ